MGFTGITFIGFTEQENYVTLESGDHEKIFKLLIFKIAS